MIITSANVHGVKSISAQANNSGDTAWLNIYLTGPVIEGHDLGDHTFEFTVFMPIEAAEAYAAAINAVNDKGREAEGEPVAHPAPYSDPLAPEPANPYHWLNTPGALK